MSDVETMGKGHRTLFLKIGEKDSEREIQGGSKVGWRIKVSIFHEFPGDLALTCK